MLVVGVVSADLGAAWAAEQGGLGILSGGEGADKRLNRVAGPVPGTIQAVLRTVQGIQGGQQPVVAAGAQGIEQLLAGTQGASPHFSD